MTAGAKKSKKKTNKALSVSLYILTVLILAFTIRYFVIMRSVVDGVSMEDTLYDGDNVLVNELSYKLSKPKRYDVIIFPERATGELLVKRVIGLPGEYVKIEKGFIYINEQPLIEFYGKDDEIADGGAASEGILLDKGEYFVLGDNRNASTDSRSVTVGNVHQDEIIGKVMLRIFPFNKFGVIK
ncbi:MAG: signal peptidase I [Lachnospiraceae bacterium]|nr:signal peptidase I [Lachnospiraceae bacterium]